MKTLPTLVAIALFAPILAALTSDQAWPTTAGWPEYGGSVRRTGSSPLAGPAAPATPFGPATLAAASFTAPVADASGNLYVGDDSGVLHKFRPDLTKAWTSPDLGGPVRASAALGPDGVVYAAPVGDNLYALDPVDGRVRWQAVVHNGAEDGYVVTAAPAVHPDGFVVQASMDGNVYAFNFDGTRRWGPVVGATDKCVAAPAIGSDGTSYLGCQDGLLRALGRDGTVRWSLLLKDTAADERLNEQQVASPSLAPDGTVYVTTRVSRAVSGSVYAVKDDGTKGTVKWRQPLNEKVTSPVTVRPDGALFIGDLGGDFFRLDPANGAIRWTFTPSEDDPDVYAATETDTPVAETLAVAELALADAAGRVYVTYWHVDLTKGFPPQESFKSPFYALKADDGSVVWREIFPKTLRSPLLAPTDRTDAQGRPMGLLYLAGDDEKLHARGQGTPLAPSASPTPTTPTTSATPETESPSPTPTLATSKGGSPGLSALAVVAAGTVLVAFLRRRV